MAQTNGDVAALKARIRELEIELEKKAAALAEYADISSRLDDLKQHIATEYARKNKRIIDLEAGLRSASLKLETIRPEIDNLSAENAKLSDLLQSTWQLLTGDDTPFTEPLPQVLQRIASADHRRFDFEATESAMIEASPPKSRAALRKVLNFTLAMYRKRAAHAGNRAKIASDPKQAAKAEAFKLWQQWQQGMALHKSGAAFARHVIATLPAIESSKVVERWVTDWQRDADKK